MNQPATCFWASSPLRWGRTLSALASLGLVLWGCGGTDDLPSYPAEAAVTRAPDAFGTTTALSDTAEVPQDTASTGGAGLESGLESALDSGSEIAFLDAAGAAPLDVPAAPALGPIQSCEAASKGWSMPELLTDGPFRVGHRDLLLTDPDRSTAAHGLVPKVDFRALPVTVWYPAEEGLLGSLTPSLGAPLAREAGPFPLLIHSHGFMSDRGELDYLAKHLATHGYVVAAPLFPLTHLTTAGGPQLSDVVNQPGDVSFVISALVGASLSPNDPLFGAVDSDRIAASGVSLGGLTTALLAYHQTLKDPRIRAIITWAAPSAMLSQASYADDDTPMLIVHGDIDAIVNYTDNALTALDRAAGLANLMTIHGGSHTGFASLAAFLDPLGPNPDAVGCQTIAGHLPDSGEFLGPLMAADPTLQAPSAQDAKPCQGELLPALAVSKQQQLVRAIGLAWLELWFGAEPQKACATLQTTLPNQNPELKLQ